eukprot:5686112-Amphidinium_carterae.1
MMIRRCMRQQDQGYNSLSQQEPVPRGSSRELVPVATGLSTEQQEASGCCRCQCIDALGQYKDSLVRAGREQVKELFGMLPNDWRLLAQI